MLDIETERYVIKLFAVWFFGSLFLSAVLASGLSTARQWIASKHGGYRYR